MSNLPNNVKQIIKAYHSLSDEEKQLARVGFDMSDEFSSIVATENTSPTEPGMMEPPDVRSRKWAFCEAIDLNGQNLKRYSNAGACWRAEIEDSKSYEGWENKDMLDSFRHQGWDIVFGDANHKEKGMRVIRPKKS